MCGKCTFSYRYMKPSVLHITLSAPWGLFMYEFSAKDLPQDSVIPTRRVHILISESSQAITLVDACSHSASLTVPHLFPSLASPLKPDPQCTPIKAFTSFRQKTDGLMPYSFSLHVQILSGILLSNVTKILTALFPF